MMGVPPCVTEELFQQDKEVLETSRMTKWNTEKQKSEPTNMVKVGIIHHHSCRSYTTKTAFSSCTTLL